jgi:flagellar FliJ protein
MTMRRSQRIGVLADLEQNESDAAARALGDSQRVLRERESVLAELRRYREDYAGAGRLRSGRLSVVAYQDYQRFLARLDEAIAQQSRLVNDALAECEVRRGEWMAARSRAMSLEKAVERCERVEERADARREQRSLDDVASSTGLAALRAGSESVH